MRNDIFRDSASVPEAAIQQYEEFKKNFKRTEDACRDVGLRFTPVVLEAHGGGWGGSLRGVVDWIAKATATLHNERESVVSAKIAQRIASTLQRESARAILRRSPAPEPGIVSSGWENFREEAIWQ